MSRPEATVTAKAHSRAAAVRSGLPLFHATRSGRIVEWNPPAEELSGIPASDAVGRSCWEVIRGRDARGGLVCHPGCSVARLAREGWPVRCTDLHVVLLADGVRAKEIASRLSLSVPTVRNHIHALLRRLGVNSQLAAVAKARDLGLCDRSSGGIPRRR